MRQPRQAVASSPATGSATTTSTSPRRPRHGMVVTNVPDYCLDEVGGPRHGHAPRPRPAGWCPRRVRSRRAVGASTTPACTASRDAPWCSSAWAASAAGRHAGAGLRPAGHRLRPVRHEHRHPGRAACRGARRRSARRRLRVPPRARHRSRTTTSSEPRRWPRWSARPWSSTRRAAAWSISTRRWPRSTSGQIAGLALDVTEPEPLPAHHPLRTHPRAIITPHMAFHSVEATEELQRRAATEVLRALTGEPPDRPVNREVLAP